MQSFTIHRLDSIYELQQQELDLCNTISAYNYSTVCLMIGYKLILNAIWNKNWKQLSNSIYIAYYGNWNSSQYCVVPNTTTILSITSVFFDSLLSSIVSRPKCYTVHFTWRQNWIPTSDSQASETNIW